MTGLASLLAENRRLRMPCEELALLLSREPDAEKVRKWLKKHARPSFGRVIMRDYQLEDWEAELWFLSLQFQNFWSIKEWEAASAETRRTHAQRVAKLARTLAEAIEEAPHPYYPPVLAFFDDGPALDILRALPEKWAASLLATTGYSLREGEYERTGPPAYHYEGQPQWESPAKNLAKSRVSNAWHPQQFPSLLRRLADYAEAQRDTPKRDHRPHVPGADARAFARSLTEYFSLFFHKTPNEVIAACMSLRFSDLDSPPTKETIRAWRGVK